MNHDILAKLEDEITIDDDIELDSHAKASIFHGAIKEMCLTFIEYFNNNKMTDDIELVLDDNNNDICGIHTLYYYFECNKYREFVLELDKNAILHSDKNKIYYSQQQDLQKLFKNNMYKNQNILIITGFNGFMLKIFNTLCKNLNMLDYIEPLSNDVRLIRLNHPKHLYLIDYKNRGDSK